MNRLIERRRAQVLYDLKWKKFLRRARFFRLAPFLDFVIGAGSMALGEVSPDSDFDVIVGARRGRIFTVRFFCAVIFGFLGWRRSRLDHKILASDKLCFNHFVTENSYRLAPPYNNYWRELYPKLIPVWGALEIISRFLAANGEWVKMPDFLPVDLRYISGSASRPAIFLERILSGRFGDFVEGVLRAVQVWKIKRGLAHHPQADKLRMAYSDDLLEFHTKNKLVRRDGNRDCISE